MKALGKTHKTGIFLAGRQHRLDWTGRGIACRLFGELHHFDDGCVLKWEWNRKVSGAQPGSVMGWPCGEAYATNMQPRGIFASSDIFLRAWYAGHCSGALVSTCFHVRVVSHRRSDVSHCLPRL
jgi:hypothetical protein